MEPTTVHLVRHGEVFNPDGVLYGRLPGYGLSDLGERMARRLGEYFADAELAALRCSPLQRARETMAPIAERHPELNVTFDTRVLEAGNELEGQVFGKDNSALFKPANWRYFVNPLRPSWGEAYVSVARRMRTAIADAAAQAPGARTVIVSHQLPIWIARCDAEGRSLIHDPRRRECNLASVTTFSLIAGRVVSVSYDEPARDLLPAKSRRKFAVGK